ncbi:MAG: RecQ family ATP-dependent DNA helicase [Treponema sp.]|nr:RecQ family ATP-dependent DNA helicase [Treponema sp.]
MEENLKIDAEEIYTDDQAGIAAYENFGIKYLYPWQRLVIANIMDAASGENQEVLGKQIVLLPTGAGKSLCFQIPALLLDGPSLVIYPLLALMSDQYRRMIEGGMSCVIFRGGQSEEEREDNFRAIKEGAKIIIANPEVLSNSNLLDRLSECNIKHVAIDEAHCVSEWGDTFRPLYLELGKVLKKLEVPVVTAFTATASPEVLSRIAQVLFDGEAHIVRSESDRPNIHYYVKHVASKKTAALILAKSEARPMIIFCGSRSRTEDMAQELNTAYGYKTAKFYHAGLERDEKTEVEEWFFNQKDAVLCATCAYGMGVDKKDIHTVVHLDAPTTAEAYIQEAGRGGRDGSVANAILLWSQEDSIKFAAYPDNSRNAALRRFATGSSCRRQVLLDSLGAEEAVCSGCDVCDSLLYNRRSEKAFFYRTPLKKINFTLKAYDLYKEIKVCRSEKYMPASNLPIDSEIAYKLLCLAEKYFTEETFENLLLYILNTITRPITQVNVWEHKAYSLIMETLKSQHRIKIMGWPWKLHISVNYHKKTFFRRLKKRFRLMLYRRHYYSNWPLWKKKHFVLLEQPQPLEQLS